MRRILDLPRDSRLVVTNGLDDKAGLRNAFSRAHGIVIPYDPLTATQKAEVLGYAQSRISARDLWHYEAWHRLGEQPDMLPVGLKLISAAIRDIFTVATGMAPNNIALIVNNNDPKDYHRHVATLTYALNGPGTEAHTVSGKPYTIPTGHMFMMAEGLPHRSPAFTPSCDDPRVMIAAF